MKKNKKIKIYLNGKTLFLAKGTSVYKVIKKTKLQPNKIAIELNKKIINKKNVIKYFLRIKIKLKSFISLEEVNEKRFFKNCI